MTSTRSRTVKRTGVALTYLLLQTTTVVAGATDVKRQLPQQDHIAGSKRIDVLREYMRRSEAYGFSGALLVEENGHVLLYEGYGLADRSREIPIATDTVFPVASITKPITATAILKLQDLGNLSITDPISKYLPNVPTDKTCITIQQLLTHTSGLVDDYRGRLDESLETAVAGMLKAPLKYPTGTKWSYSNLGYGLLAAIVQSTSGGPLQTFVERTIFQPAGMAKSGYLGDGSRWKDGRVAHTYNRERDSGSPTLWDLTLQGQGAGALITSPGDLLAFWNALEKGMIISAKAAASATTPHAEVRKDWGYGYGWHRFKTEYGPVIYHGGNRTPDGVTAEFRHYPERQVTTILTVNVMRDETGYNRAVRDDIAAILFGGDYTMPPAFSADSPRLPPNFTGRYSVGDNAFIGVEYLYGRLILFAEGQAAIDVVLSHDDETRSEMRRYNEQVHGIATDACAGKTTNGIAEDWPEVLSKIGRCEAIDVLGTLRSGQELESRVTFARVRGTERANTLVRFIAWDDDFYVVEGGSSINLFDLMPTATREFVGYDLFTHNSIAVRFNNDGGNVAMTLRHGPHEDVFRHAH